MVGEPDPLLVEVLLETAEKMCGFRPTTDDISHFLSKNKDQVLVETYDEPEPEPAKPIASIPKDEFGKHVSGRGTGPIIVKLNEKRFEESSIPQLYKSVLKYFVDSGVINKAQIPWGVGSKRYFIFKGPKPIHQNGKEFFQPVTYGEYHLEGHVERSQGAKYLGMLCERLGFKFVLEKI